MNAENALNASYAIRFSPRGGISSGAELVIQSTS